MAVVISNQFISIRVKPENRKTNCMTIKKVLKIGNPILTQVSQPVSKFNTPELDQLITDMRDTMLSLNGAGIAAPQIGVLQRVVIFGTQQNPRYPDQEPVPETVLINPVIEVLGDQTLGMWEGCLSVPGMRGFVQRPSSIRYRGFNQLGEPIDRSVDGFHATVVQHECDHLDGILYPMQISDLRLFGQEQELEKRHDYPN